MKHIIIFLFLLAPLAAFAQLPLPYGIQVLTSDPLDYWYGPYESVEAANAATPTGRRPIQTVLIDGVEYWWRDGVEDEDLVVKTGGGSSGWNATGTTTLTGDVSVESDHVIAFKHGEDVSIILDETGEETDEILGIKIKAPQFIVSTTAGGMSTEDGTTGFFFDSSDGNLASMSAGGTALEISPSGSVNISGGVLTGYETTTSVNNRFDALVWKNPVTVASTEDIALSGVPPLTIDGVVVTALSGTRVLLKDQADKKENGIYSTIVTGETYTLNRIASQHLPNVILAVNEGTTQSGKVFRLSLPTTTITLGTDDIEFTEFGSGSGGELKAGNGIEVVTDSLIFAGRNVSVDSLDILAGKRFTVGFLEGEYAPKAIYADSMAVGTDLVHTEYGIYTGSSVSQDGYVTDYAYSSNYTWEEYRGISRPGGGHGIKATLDNHTSNQKMEYELNLNGLTVKNYGLGGGYVLGDFMASGNAMQFKGSNLSNNLTVFRVEDDSVHFTILDVPFMTMKPGGFVMYPLKAPTDSVHMLTIDEDGLLSSRRIDTLVSIAQIHVMLDSVDTGGGGGSPDWGDIGGTLSDQTDLQNELDGKADLSGATFTGQVVTTSDATDAGLVIGTYNGDVSNLAIGSLWRNGSNQRLQYVTNTSAIRSIPFFSSSDVITGRIPVIAGTDGRLGTGVGFTYSSNILSTPSISVSTGATLPAATLIGTDPAEDALLFWDDSESETRYLGIGTGLEISGGDLVATGGGGSVTFGDAGTVPIVNSGEDDFDYTAYTLPATDGTSNQVLTTNGSGVASWQTPSSGFADPMTTRGDIIYRNSSNTTARLGVGSSGYVLTSDGTDVAWAANTAGTVTSVGLTVPTGLEVTGSPITSSGTLAVSYASGYQGYTGTEASKLSGIEDNADVTDATNVAAAGAIMDGDFSSNGMMARTASGTYASRTITGTADRISVSNGTGASSNPTIDIASTYVGQNTITTLGTIATGTWNATDIPLSAGGTGASLSDPNADRIMFWDDSDGAVEWLEVGSGLSLSGNTLTATGGVGGLTANRVLVSDGSGDLIAGDVTTTELSILDGATLSTSELNTLDGITASTTELNYNDGVTSNIQTQLDGKQTITPTTATGSVVAFDTNRSYCTSASPCTGNITFNSSGAVVGQVATMIHNDSSEPTFGSEFIVLSGTYVTNEDNYIMFFLRESGKVWVTISQEQ